MTPDRRTCPICDGTGRTPPLGLSGIQWLCSCQLPPFPPLDLMREMAEKSDPTIWRDKTKTTLIPDRDPVTDEITNVTLEELGF